MMACAAFMAWAKWFPTVEEALAVCLDRRQLPISVMLPSQLRYLSYFESFLQGTPPVKQSLRLNRVMITSLPNLENGTCSPFIEVSFSRLFSPRSLIGIRSCSAAIEKEVRHVERSARSMQAKPPFSSRTLS